MEYCQCAYTTEPRDPYSAAPEHTTNVVVVVTFVVEMCVCVCVCVFVCESTWDICVEMSM
jgi:hypothetical protein